MRRPVRISLALSVVIALLVGPVALAATTTTTASITPRFTKESYTTFQTQLADGQVRAVTFNKKAHSLHITTTDGKLLLASYPPEQYKTIHAQITAKGVPVTIEKVKKAGTTTTTTTHHKLRYIAAGILVLVVIVIALVLGFNRRRPPAEQGPDAPAAASGPPSEPDAAATGD